MISIFLKRYQGFAKLARVDSSLFETVSDYYENLIRVTPSDDRGKMKFNQQYLNDMILHTKSKEDLEITINAYYNFLGHNC